MASFFQILVFNKTKNLSLGFRVGKFRDGGLLDIVYGFIFPKSLILSKTNTLSLRFRVGNFAIVASLIAFMASFFQNLIFNKTKNLSLGFGAGNFRGSSRVDIVCGFDHFYILVSNKINILSLGFRVGKFRDSGLLDIFLVLFFQNLLEVKKNMQL